VERKVALGRPPERRDAYAHGVLAIVPFKGFDGAKTRLAERLREEERAALAAEMLERVLSACARAGSIRRTLLVTPAPSSTSQDVDVLVDAGTGHADAVELALADPGARAGVLVVMADCPLVDPDALDALAGAARPLALVPSEDGGVNALALRRVDGFRPRFGVPAETMIAAAHRAGLEPTVLHDPRLAFDVDRPADLARL
jgi:2-phospho-L-lactate/phosphoenolpyruvate guanylyltransferase